MDKGVTREGMGEKKNSIKVSVEKRYRRVLF
jgi:hypothetical protein